MTTRRLRFVVGAALLVGAPACGDDDDTPITCNTCVDAQIDTGSLADGGGDADDDSAAPGGE